MDMADSLQRFFTEENLKYQTHPHIFETDLSKLSEEMGIDPQQIAVPVLLRSKRQAMLMAVIPLSHNLDRARLRGLLRRDFDYVDESEMAAQFLDAEPGANPPIPQPYNLPCIIDRSLLLQHRIFMRPGSHRQLISIDQQTVKALYQNFPKAVISNDSGLEGVTLAKTLRQDIATPRSINDIYNELDKIKRVPAIPALAMQILQQTSDPDTTAEQLSNTIEQDPGVTAQVLRYAASPYFGFRGRLDSVQDAITNVLGFELVSHIAFGISASKAFLVQGDGPIGVNAYWKHALHCAVTCQSLAQQINKPELLHPSRAYLCGLLHNIGVLLMGHLFPAEFKLLNRMLEKRPTTALHHLEQELIGMGDAQKVFNIGHEHVGGYLLQKWGLPDDIVAAAYYHHDERYRGKSLDYVRLTQIANRLLMERGIGDMGKASAIDTDFGKDLISLSNAEAVFHEVMENSEEIDNLADYMAA